MINKKDMKLTTFRLTTFLPHGVGARVDNLAKAPYLVLFIILISMGVGTASALITITLSGDVIITDSLNVDTDTLVVDSANDRVGIGVASPTQKLDVDGNVQVGNSLFVGTTTSGDVDSIWMADGSERILWDGVTDNRFETTADLAIGGNAFVFGDGRLSIGTHDAKNDDFIFFDDGSEFLLWDESATQFRFTDAIVTPGVIQAGFNGPDVGYNRIGGGVGDSGVVAGPNDLFVTNNIQVGGNLIAKEAIASSGGGFFSTDGFAPLSVSRVGNDGTLIHFSKDASPVGSIVLLAGVVSYNAFTGSHYAWTDKVMQKGLLVSMTGDNQFLNDNTESEILYGIEITSKKNDPAILGTYLSLQEPDLEADTNNPHLIMSEGNGEVWVANTGENINPGDYLISSLVPGHAMKDDRSGETSHIVGRAAEPIMWDEVNETINGVKHQKISILFNFVPLNNQILN